MIQINWTAFIVIIYPLAVGHSRSLSFHFSAPRVAIFQMYQTNTFSRFLLQGIRTLTPFFYEKEIHFPGARQRFSTLLSSQWALSRPPSPCPRETEMKRPDSPYPILSHPDLEAHLLSSSEAYASGNGVPLSYFLSFAEHGEIRCWRSCLSNGIWKGEICWNFIIVLF